MVDGLWLHQDVSAVPPRRRTAFVLFGVGALLILLALGLAFTVWGELAALLGLISFGIGAVFLARDH